MSGRCRKRPAEGAGGLDGGMRQSGRVRCGGRGGGRYGLVADGGRRAHRSPLTPVVPVPEARARPGSTAQPRGLCRAAAFVRVRPRPRGSRRAAAQPGPKAGHGAAHSHPPAGLHPPPPPRHQAHLYLPCLVASSRLRGWLQPRGASFYLVGERDPYGDYRTASWSFTGQQRGCAGERTQVRVWLGA